MILVTGGTGLVGGHLLYKLLKAGERVRVLKRPSSNLNKTKHIFGFYGADALSYFDLIEWVDGDLLDYDSLRESLKNIEVVYHTGAMVSFNPKMRHELMRTNEEGTANLVNLSLEMGIKKFCFVSSIASLGNSKNGEVIDEFSYWQGGKDHSVYSLSKFKSEMEVWRATKEGLNAVIVNPSVIIGPGDWSQGSPRTIQTIAKGMKFYTTGGTGFVDVRDVVTAMVTLVKSDVQNERFILNGVNLTYQDLFNRIADGLGVKRPSIRAQKVLVNLGWRFEKLKNKITGSEPMITKESARTSLKRTQYSGEAIKERIQFNYTPFNTTITESVNYYKETSEVCL